MDNELTHLPCAENSTFKKKVRGSKIELTRSKRPEGVDRSDLKGDSWLLMDFLVGEKQGDEEVELDEVENGDDEDLGNCY